MVGSTSAGSGGVLDRVGTDGRPGRHAIQEGTDNRMLPSAASPISSPCPSAVHIDRSTSSPGVRPADPRGMKTTDDVAPIRVTGPAGLLATVPQMLGFHPTNSLVLMCVSGERRRVGPVARVDLPAGHDRALAAHLTGHALNHADEVVVITYQRSRRRPPLLDDLLAELARAGVDVMDALVVRGGRARPALNAAMERAHPGIPLLDSNDPTVRALSAAGALAGRSVLADRDELRDSIAAPTGERLRRAERAMDAACAGPEPTGIRAVPSSRAPSSSHPSGQPLLDGRVTGLVDRAIAQVSSTGQVDVEVAAAIAVLTTDAIVRDALLAQAVTQLDRPWLPMLIGCARWTPDALAPPVCSMLAMVAYRHGDGALAQIAVDRCLMVEPEHGLAHLMIAIMAAGVRPEELERFATGNLGAESEPE